MPTLAAEVVQLISDIKVAIKNLNQSEDSNVLIQTYSITLKTVFEVGASAGTKDADLWLVKVGANASLTQTLVLNFELATTEGFDQQGSSVNEAITRAGQAVDSALQEAARGANGFVLKASSVELQFVVGVNGEITFGESKAVVNASNTNTIIVNFKAKDLPAPEVEATVKPVLDLPPTVSQP